MLQDILKKHWLFGVLKPSRYAELTQQFSIKFYRKNEFVFHQLDRPEQLYVILEGEVSIETYSLDGKVIKITHLDAGEVFGELALIDRGSRSASAVTTKTARIASLRQSVFQQLIESETEFSQRLLVVLVERLRKSNQQVESLVTQTLLQRTAKLLCDLQLKEGNTIKVTQKQLGERLFASREKVNGKIKALENLEAIATSRGHVEILNLPLLKKLGDMGA